MPRMRPHICIGTKCKRIHVFIASHAGERKTNTSMWETSLFSCYLFIQAFFPLSRLFLWQHILQISGSQTVPKLPSAFKSWWAMLVSHLYFSPALKKKKIVIFAAPYKAKWQNVGLGVCIFQKYIHSQQKKCKKKTKMSNNCVFR